MFGVAGMREIREAVGAYAAGFDAALVTAADGQRIVEDAVAAENMLATVKAMAARRVSETDLWRKEGDASAAHQLARKSGTSVGKAREALETAGRLGGLPALEEAARRGEVSPDQAAPIADAASKAPGAERRLLTTAKAASLGELRDACARTKAAAQPDDEARQRAIHASRFLRRRRTADGAGELLYRSTLEEVAEMYAIVQAWADRRFRAARTEGRYEPGEAYLADGLLDAVRASRAGGGASAPRGGKTSPANGGGAGAPGGRGSGAATDGRAAAARGRGPGDENGGGRPASDTTVAGDTIADSRPAGADATDVTSDTTTAPGAPSLFATEPFPATTTPAPVDPAAFDGAVATPPPKPPSPAKVVVRIDWDALVRGWPIDGEVCEIAGLGPVPVAAVRRMIESGDAFLTAVVTKGVDVVNVAHLGRRPTAFQQTGLDWRSPECTTLGCNTTVRLENDHRVPWVDSKITLLSGMDPGCGRCHDLKTYKGWAWVEGTGKRPMVPPDDPRHPRYRNQGPAPPREHEVA